MKTVEVKKEDIFFNDTTLPILQADLVGADVSAEEFQRIREDVKQHVMEIIAREDSVASRLVACKGHIFYMAVNSKEIGVSFDNGNTGSVVGDNLYGELLEECRDHYLKEMKDVEVQEVPMRKGQVVVDFIPYGAGRSYIEEREVFSGSEAGNENKYIHTDKYRPVRFRFDADKSGTTGHSQRENATGVSFQTFECPFSTDSLHKLRVDTAAEISMYFEQALRGELDWDALFEDLKSRGNIRNLTEYQEIDLKRELDAQFAWMREEIMTNASLKEKTIVAESLVIPDYSMGRSVYHPDFAPCPAHILARYINNPHLFYSKSQNSVIRGLEMENKEEPLHFRNNNLHDTVSILVDGSDTIGGRVPGTRATPTTRDVYMKYPDGSFVLDGRGNKVVEKKTTTMEFQFKNANEVEADYQAFSSRMDSIIKNIDPSVSIRFITGTSVGTPQMVKRYVKERTDNGAVVTTWDFSKKSEVRASKSDNENPSVRFRLLQVPNFNKVFPVLIGAMDKITFALDQNSDDSEVSFSSKDIVPNCMVSFSAAEDAHNNDVLNRASLAESQDGTLSFLHVMNNTTEDNQVLSLKSDCFLTRSAFIGNMTYDKSLFDGEIRNSWEIEKSSVLSQENPETKEVVPVVCRKFPSPVYVSGIPFHTVYGAYNAFLLNERSGKDIDAIMNLSNMEDNIEQMIWLIDHSENGKDSVTPEQDEAFMRNSVHMMSQANQSFADILIGTGSSDIVCTSTVGGTMLFTDLAGNGENRFGVVLKAERDILCDQLEVARQKAEIENERINEDNRKRQRINTRKHAEGEKVSDGLPQTIEEIRDAVWIIGTHQPIGLSLPEEEPSFVEWLENGPDGVRDDLNREKASRLVFRDFDGEELPNKYIYIFPTDMGAVSGRRHVQNNPDRKDLTGLMRINPETGEEFVCAYGIAVKKNNQNYELGNKWNMPCSYMLDSDSHIVMNSILQADSEAREMALRQNMALCYSIYQTDKEKKDSLSRVFSPKMWDVRKSRNFITSNRKEDYISELEKIVRKYIVFPKDEMISAPDGDMKIGQINRDDEKGLTFTVYTPEGDQIIHELDGNGNPILSQQEEFPLDMLDLADIRKIYGSALNVYQGPVKEAGEPVPTKVKTKKYNRDKKQYEYESKDVYKKEWVENPHASTSNAMLIHRYEDILNNGANYPLNCFSLPKKDYTDVEEWEFVADLSMVLSLANASAIRQGVPLRFPLGNDGKIDLGPDIPERFKEIAENRINSFIGVVRDNDLNGNELMDIHRISDYEAFMLISRNKYKMENNGSDIYLRPNDLMNAFGKYDFHAIEIGKTSPMHEMCFETTDGTVFKVIDTRLSRHFTTGEINKYLSYSKNDPCRFKVMSSDPDRIGEFVVSLKEYCDRAKEVQVRTRLVSEEEMSRIYSSKLDVAFNDLLSTSEEYQELESQYKDAVDNGSDNDLIQELESEIRAFKDTFRSEAAVQVDEESLQGFVNMFSSNDDRIEESENDLSSRGPVTALEAPNRFDGTEGESIYYGKTDARDGFQGYAQFAYLLPGDERNINEIPEDQLVWNTVKDLEVAKDIIMMSTNRVYRSDTRVLPSKSVMNGILRSMAIKQAGDEFRKLDNFVRKEKVNEKVISLKNQGVSVSDDNQVKETAESVSADQSVSENALKESVEVFRTYSGTVESLEPNQIFVFGSNTEGRHGKGAAKTALDKFGAVYGQAEGLQGQSFAIVTKDLTKKVHPSRSPQQIIEQIEQLYLFASKHPEKEFLVAYSGTGQNLNAYSNEEMASFFCTFDIPSNMVFEEKFGELIKDTMNDAVLNQVKNSSDSSEDYQNIERAESLVPSLDVPEKNLKGLFEEIEFTTSQYYDYATRTKENANAFDVDFTLAFAVDFSTSGEKCTQRYAGDSLIQIDLPVKEGGGLDLSQRSINKMAKTIINALPDNFVQGEPFGVNIAGNGISTLSKDQFRIEQEELNSCLYAVGMQLKRKGINISSVRSGGQTGVDEAGAVMGKCMGIPTTVHTTSNWRIRDKYGRDIANDIVFFQKRFSDEVCFRTQKSVKLPAVKKVAEIKR